MHIDAPPMWDVDRDEEWLEVEILETMKKHMLWR